MTYWYFLAGRFTGGMSSPRQYKEMPPHPFTLPLENHPHHSMYHPHPSSALPELQYSYDHMYGAGGERCRSQPGGKFETGRSCFYLGAHSVFFFSIYVFIYFFFHLVDLAFGSTALFVVSLISLFLFNFIYVVFPNFFSICLPYVRRFLLRNEQVEPVMVIY